MEIIKRKLGKLFPFSFRDLGITLLILVLASLICTVLKSISETDSHVPLIFVLAVLFVSSLTNGYLFGLLSSVIAVFGVNYVFTYPYFHLNFSISGYPLTFICSFAVSVITCTLTSRARLSERMRLEGEKERIRATLLRAISHDFRTPLTSIIGSISAVMENGDKLPESEKAALLCDARSDAEWLINMVENILSITRFGSDSSTILHKEPQAVEEVIGEAVSKFHRQYPKLKVEVKIPDELLLVPMDAMLIEQVIINLLINSAIHGQTVTRAMLSVQSQEHYAKFQIDDDGVGFVDGLPDFSLSDPTSAKSSLIYKDTTRNVGIGLSVCNAIVTAHAGHMTAKNLRQGGASISFYLPLMEETKHGNKNENIDC